MLVADGNPCLFGGFEGPVSLCSDDQTCLLAACAGTVAATGLTGSIAAPFTGSLAGGAPAVSTGAGHLTGILPNFLSRHRFVA